MVHGRKRRYVRWKKRAGDMKLSHSYTNAHTQTHVHTHMHAHTSQESDGGKRTYYVSYMKEIVQKHILLRQECNRPIIKKKEKRDRLCETKNTLRKIIHENFKMKN